MTRKTMRADEPAWLGWPSFRGRPHRPQGAADSSVMLCDNAPIVTLRTFNTEGLVVAADHLLHPSLGTDRPRRGAWSDSGQEVLRAARAAAVLMLYASNLYRELPPSQRVSAEDNPDVIRHRLSMQREVAGIRRYVSRYNGAQRCSLEDMSIDDLTRGSRMPACHCPSGIAGSGSGRLGRPA